MASRIARRPADTLRSYGYHRVQILSALLNGIGFIVVVVWIVIEAVQRLLSPVEVLGGIMLSVAGAGLLVNVIAFLILHGGSSQNLNLRGAAVHVLGDLLGSLAAIFAAVVILFTGWMPIDPLLSVLVALLILRSAWFVVRKSTHILLEGTPDDVDITELRDTLVESVPDVRDVHHVHVWSLTPARPLLTMHANIADSADYTAVLEQVKAVLVERYGIEHSTVQLEPQHCVDDHPSGYTAGSVTTPGK
jgi:cobalt-zinc-cadmium efflux system protein